MLFENHYIGIIRTYVYVQAKGLTEYKKMGTLLHKERQMEIR